jgi:hypothetical protein
MAAYIPPHARAAPAPTPTAEPAPAAGGGSLADWLAESRKGYVPKTPEQIRIECLSMNYAQLKARAGPPPPISSDDFGGVWEQGGEGEGARACISFDESIKCFKKGYGPPPEPLSFDGRDEPVVNAALAMEGVVVVIDKSESGKRRAAYASWYSQWGRRLRELWAADHAVPVKKKLPPRRSYHDEENKEPSRGALAAAAAEVVSEKSGW